MQAVRDSEELRKAVEEVQPLQVRFGLRLAQSRPLYRAFQALRDGPEWAALSEARKRVVENELRDFVLGGVALEVCVPSSFFPGTSSVTHRNDWCTLLQSWLTPFRCSAQLCTPRACCFLVGIGSILAPSSRHSSNYGSCRLMSVEGVSAGWCRGVQGQAKERFNEIKQELSQISTQFSNNLLDATKAFKKVITDKADVDGLPASALALGAQQVPPAHNLTLLTSPCSPHPQLMLSDPESPASLSCFQLS